jgi:hypothetical protein
MKSSRMPYSPLDRLLLSLGRPFGLCWIPDGQLGIVHRRKGYHRLCGPGFFWIIPWYEQLRDPTISIEPDSIQTTISNLQTRDHARLRLTVSLTYVFNPRFLPHNEVVPLIRQGKKARDQKVLDAVKVVLESITPRFNAEPICRGDLHGPIEEDFEAELTAQMGKALELYSFEILEVTTISEDIPPGQDQESRLGLWSTKH